MTDFDWLRKVIEARKPGPWTRHWQSKISQSHYICDDKDPSAFARVYGYDNANFIATVGTLADKMLAVIEQAALHTYHPECELNNDPLRRALAALKAAKPEGLE